MAAVFFTRFDRNPKFIGLATHVRRSTDAATDVSTLARLTDSLDTNSSQCVHQRKLAELHTLQCQQLGRWLVVRRPGGPASQWSVAEHGVLARRLWS